jgi:biotin operon repressor
MIHLEKTLEPCEKLMLKSMINKKDFSIMDLADELGMSRQGANKKYNKFKEKMARILREMGYVAC